LWPSQRQIPDRGRGKRRMMKRTAKTAGLVRTTLALCAIFLASFFAKGASAQIAKVIDDDGRRDLGRAQYADADCHDPSPDESYSAAMAIALCSGSSVSGSPMNSSCSHNLRQASAIGRRL